MYWVRHGQSLFNLAHDMTGQDPDIADPPLTPRGQLQARQAAQHLRGAPVTRVVSSPYTWALQTATAIAELFDLTIQVEPLIGERALYSCDIGSPVADLRRDWPGLDFLMLPDGQWWPEQGESERALRARLSAFAARMAGDPDHERTVYVSHWYFIRAATGQDMHNGQVHRVLV